MKAFTPRPFQSEGIDFLLNNSRCGLWWEPGIGKTPTVASAIEILYNSLDVHRVLVVAPLEVARSTWPREFAKWEHLARIPRLFVHHTNPTERARMLLTEKSAVHIVSYETFKWAVKLFKNAKRWPYDMVVFDEGTKMKSPSSKTFYAARAISKLTNVRRIVILTGTPAPNGLVDIWAPTFVLDHGVALEVEFEKRLHRKSSMAFKYAMFRPVNRMHTKWKPLTGTEEWIYDRVRGLYSAKRARVELGLPNEIPPHDTLIDLPAKVRAQYRQLERELFVELERGVDIEAVNKGVLSNKLRQICNGAAYYDESRSWASLHDEKLAALEELAGSVTEPLLVAYEYAFDAQRLKKKFGDDFTIWDGRAETEDAWNKKLLPMMGANPQQVAHGMNWQEGSNHTAWFGLPWNYELYAQFNERLGDTRQFQSNTGLRGIVHRLIARDTVEDSIVAAALADKQSVEDALMEAVS